MVRQKVLYVKYLIDAGILPITINTQGKLVTAYQTNNQSLTHITSHAFHNCIFKYTIQIIRILHVYKTRNQVTLLGTPKKHAVDNFP